MDEDMCVDLGGTRQLSYSLESDEDGSLSVKFKDGRYFNLEVAHKALEVQKMMLAALSELVNSNNSVE